MSQLRDAAAVETGRPTPTPGLGREPTVRELRRWVRRRQVAARASVSLETLYVLAVTAAIAIALLGSWLRRVLWPAVPVDASAWPATSALLAAAGVALLLTLRRLGPLVLGRSDLAWLLHTPVSRRGLLLPALARALCLAAVAGATLALLAVGRLAPRPTDGAETAAWLAAGAGAGGCAALLATAAQRDPRLGRWLDRMLTVALCALGAVVLLEPAAPATPTIPGPGLLAALTVTAAGAFTAATVRGLRLFPAAALHEPAADVGAYLDSAYVMDPSFTTDLRERRFWRRRTLRSAPLRRGMPVPAQHELRVLRRKLPRLGWLAGAAAVPAMLADGASWMLALALVGGALTSASTTAEATRRDVAQPALLRLLGLPARRVLAVRLLTATALASLWCALALTALALLGGLPPGPWWALGLAFGPVAGVAALRRARIGAINHGLPLIDTPMGAFPPGPLLWLLTGLDLLVPLGLPMLTALFGADSVAGPSWQRVLLQAVLAVGGALGYLWFAADRRRATL
ncbi:DUF6297 family protein [Micromonospora sp. RTGN7]|uniref:DUF6297 family protein n=1 Tax=Micromonospora sp. RTGN7 TaxID=3016526 RepID=UPI0029FF0372|nr:DUF6297 family protein [Micromonospora sp. RTGN7]